MPWTFTTSGSAIYRAGTNANSTVTGSGSILQEWSDQVEGRIVAETRRDWITGYSGLSNQIKGILNQVASADIAKQIISYDMSGFLSRAEAITMLNVQDDVFREGIRILKDFKSNTIQST